MATDLSKLQEIINNAEQNEAVIAQVQRTVGKVNALLAELTQLLNGELPVTARKKPGRQPKAAGETGAPDEAGQPGKKRGRKPKNTAE